MKLIDEFHSFEKWVEACLARGFGHPIQAAGFNTHVVTKDGEPVGVWHGDKAKGTLPSVAPLEPVVEPIVEPAVGTTVTAPVEPVVEPTEGEPHVDG